MNVPNNRRNIVLRHGIGQFLLDHVEVIHVGLVVLAVVDLHNLGGDHLEIDKDRKDISNCQLTWIERCLLIISTRILLAPKRCSRKEDQVGCAERVNWNDTSDFVFFYIFDGGEKLMYNYY